MFTFLKKSSKWFYCAGPIFILYICVCQQGGEKMDATKGKMSGLDFISQEGWNSLLKKRIFFGHQSVGNDIINGIKDIEMQSKLVRLSIKQTRDPNDFEQPVFGESGIGKNEDPKSKIDDFRGVMESGLGAKVDIAFFKLCFIDINPQTDVPALFSHYKTVMDSLKSEFPKVRFIHCTAPLTTMDSGIKLFIKRLLGKDGGSSANLKRGAYNRLIVDTYGTQGNVFDIARCESTLPNGSRMVRRANGRDCFGLVPAYSTDGGHLNQAGREIVAQECLNTLLADQ
jgi:hypothetical protein